MLNVSSPKPQKYNVRTGEIWLDETNILYLKIKKDAEIELQDVEDCFDLYKQLGIGPDNKVLQLIDGRAGYFSFSPEGKSYATKVGHDFFIASALVNDSLAIRLAGNLFNTFYKPKIPFKIFNYEEAAIKWLETFI